MKNASLASTANNHEDKTTQITEGWVIGSRVSFVERISFLGSDLMITCTGETTSNVQHGGGDADLWVRWSDLTLAAAPGAVPDLWKQEVIAPAAADGFSTRVPSHGVAFIPVE